MRKRTRVTLLRFKPPSNSRHEPCPVCALGMECTLVHEMNAIGAAGVLWPDRAAMRLFPWGAGCFSAAECLYGASCDDVRPAAPLLSRRFVDCVEVGLRLSSLKWLRPWACLAACVNTDACLLLSRRLRGHQHGKAKKKDCSATRRSEKNISMPE